MTSLTIERISLSLNTETKNKFESPEIRALLSLGFDETKKFLRKGDAVILLPVFSPPDLNKKDNNGNYLSSRLIIRRGI